MIELLTPEFVRELEHMPSIRPQFPHKFADGEVRVEVHLKVEFAPNDAL